MHDLGSIEKHTFFDNRVRGGGFWGVTNEDARDIAAWTSFAEQLGYNRVVLVGPASGGVGGAGQPGDSAEHRAPVEKTRRLVAAGAGDDLLRLPNRSYPS